MSSVGSHIQRANDEIESIHQCIAICNNGKQCTRKQKHQQYCGTHTHTRSNGTILDKTCVNSKQTFDSNTIQHDACKHSNTHRVTTHTATQYQLPINGTYDTNVYVDVWVQNINGISYFIDSNHNIYSPELIISGHKQAVVIGKWAQTPTDDYYISEYYYDENDNYVKQLPNDVHVVIP